MTQKLQGVYIYMYGRAPLMTCSWLPTCYSSIITAMKAHWRKVSMDFPTSSHFIEHQYGIHSHRRLYSLANRGSVIRLASGLVACANTLMLKLFIAPYARVERNASMCEYPAENAWLLLASYCATPLSTALNHSFLV